MANSALGKRVLLGVLGVLGVGLLVLFAVAIIWLQQKRGPSFLNVTLGNAKVADLEEDGFFHDEGDRDGPFRWTNGHGKLLIPLERAKPPRILVVYLDSHRQPGTPSIPLRIAINGQEVFSDDIRVGRWRTTFDLEKMDLGDRLNLEIISDTFKPLGVLDGGKSDDPRALGVQVREIKLVRDEPAKK